MRTHRLYTTEPLETGTVVTLGKSAAHYLLRVLRLPAQCEIVMFNGDGSDYLCRLTDSGTGTVRAQVLEKRCNDADSPLRITLSQAMSRGERMDYCLQKATELGVAAVQLLLSERVELKLTGPRLEKRLAHWRGVMESASEQCGRATVPDLRAPIPVSEWWGLVGNRVVLNAGAGKALREIDLTDAVDIAVGPEGGFSDAELGGMTDAGVVAARLGPRILRTETAGPAAIAVLQSVAGDF